jgi:hypothetical protein
MKKYMRYTKSIMCLKYYRFKRSKRPMERTASKKCSPEVSALDKEVLI